LFYQEKDLEDTAKIIEPAGKSQLDSACIVHHLLSLYMIRFQCAVFFLLIFHFHVCKTCAIVTRYYRWLDLPWLVHLTEGCVFETVAMETHSDDD